MLAGNPDRFAVLTERVPVWESPDYISGILELRFRGVTYPPTLRNTTLSTDLYAILSPHSSFAEPPIDTALAALPPDAAFPRIIAEPERFRAPFHELGNAGFSLYTLSDGQQVTLMLGQTDATGTQHLRDVITLPAEELAAIRGSLADDYAELRSQKSAEQFK